MKLFFTLISLLVLSLTVHAQQMVTTYEGTLGHTTGYDVASFTDVRDKTLNDVMNKMPGVSASGFRLTYNGMRIGKVFIGNNDIRSGFNTVAGIKPENIEKIELVENYQAIKVLQNRQFSNTAALNIVLKDDSRSNWNGTAKLGGGMPALYDADFYAIQMTNNRQSMFNVKVNNTGLNLRRSISFFMPDDLGFNPNNFRLPSYVNVRISSARLSEERVRFNQSMLFNTINTIKLSDNYQMVLQLAYQKDNLASERRSETTYFLSDSAIVDVAGEKATSSSDEVFVNIAILANTDKYYLSNHIFAQANISRTSMNLTGSHPNEQSAGTNYYNLVNNFSYLRTFGQWNLTLLSRNQLTSFPQTLKVAREDSSRQNQSVDTRSFYSDTRFSYGFTSNQWTTSFRGGIIVMNRGLSSMLKGVDDLEIQNNKSNFGYTSGYIQPTLNYVSERLQGEIGLPVNIYHNTFRGQPVFDEMERDSTSKSDLVNFTPFVSLKYNVSPLLSVSVEGRVQYDDIDAGSFYTGMILTNYKIINQGALNYRLNERRSLETSVAFKLPQHSFFVNGRVQRMWGKSKYSNFDTFQGDYILVGTVSQESDSRSWIVSGDINKGITSLRGSVGLNISFINSELSRIRNNETILFVSNRWTVSPRINGRLTRWLNVVYDLSYNHSSVNISISGSTSKSDEYNQSLELIFTPVRTLNFSVLGEHYHTLLPNRQAKNMVLADFQAEYQLSEKWQLIGSVTNILDQQDYAYTVIDGLTTSHTSYRIRPRNFLVSLYYNF